MPTTQTRSTHGNRSPSMLHPAMVTITDIYEVHRHWWLPLLLTGYLVGIATMLYLLAYEPVTWLVWIVAGVVWAATLEHTGDLPGLRERVWSRVALLCAPALGAWINLIGPITPYTVPVLGWTVTPLWVTAFVAVPFGVAWSNHRRVQLRAQGYKNILAWDADAVDMRGVEAPPQTATTDGEVTEVDLVPLVGGKWTLQKMRSRIPNIAARWGVPESKITITKKPRQRGHSFIGRLRIDESETAPTAVIYKLPEAPVDIRQPYAQGKQSGGEPLLGQLYRPGHGAVDGLTGGDRGSGKTKKRQRDAAQVVTSFNAMLWVADLKPGSPNWKAWAGLCDWYTTEAETFKNMLLTAWAASFSPVRTEEETHDPGGYDPDGVYRGDPAVVILLDECAIAFNPNEMAVKIEATDKMKAKNAADHIVAVTKQFAQVSRSTAHGLLFSTVRLDFTSFGNDAAVRAFVSSGERAGFMTKRAADGRFLFAHDQAPDLSTLPQDAPGTGWFESYLYPDAVMGRSDLFITNLKDPSTPKDMEDTHVDQLYKFVARFPQCFPTYRDETLAMIREKVGSVYDDRERHDRQGLILNPATAAPTASPAGPGLRVVSPPNPTNPPNPGPEPVVVTDDATGEAIPQDDDTAQADQNGLRVPGTGRLLVCPRCSGGDVAVDPNASIVPGGDAMFTCRGCGHACTWTDIATHARSLGLFDAPTGAVPAAMDTVPTDDDGADATVQNLDAYRPPKRSDSAQDSRQMAWDALHELGGWNKTPAVAAQINRSPELTRIRLQELETQGRVEQRGRNAVRQYRAVGDPEIPVK